MKNIENKIKGSTFIEQYIKKNIESEMNGLYNFFKSDLPKECKKEDTLEKEQIRFLLEHINYEWNINLKELDRKQFLAGICKLAKENNCTNDLALMLTGSFNMEDYVGTN